MNPTPPKEHQFKPGQSGNPKGRPPKLPELDRLLAEVLDDEKDGLTAAKAILLKLRQKAIGGDIRAAEIILNRAYGKPKESLELKAQVTSMIDDPEFKARIEKYQRMLEGKD